MPDDRTDGFAVHLVPEDGRVVVVVRGEIDLSTAGELRTALAAAMDGCDRLEIDLRDTTFMDSTGLAVLAAATQRLGTDRRALVLRNPSPIIRKVLDVSGVTAMVDIRPAARARSR